MEGISTEDLPFCGTAPQSLAWDYSEWMKSLSQAAFYTTNPGDNHSCLFAGSESTIQGIRWLQFYTLDSMATRISQGVFLVWCLWRRLVCVEWLIWWSSQTYPVYRLSHAFCFICDVIWSSLKHPNSQTLWLHLSSHMHAWSKHIQSCNAFQPLFTVVMVSHNSGWYYCTFLGN
jgi:hypothetical protein